VKPSAAIVWVPRRNSAWRWVHSRHPATPDTAARSDHRSTDLHASNDLWRRGSALVVSERTTLDDGAHHRPMAIGYKPSAIARRVMEDTLWPVRA
jgi:hypothetical protein